MRQQNSPYIHASLFSGIGGFDLAAQIVGWRNAFSCEIDPFCNRVLKFHFPNETQYNDIRWTDFSVWRGRIDVLSGGFPCQPFSQAGKRKGTDDDRHLWPAMLGAIQQIRPRWVVGENVRGIVNWNAGMVFEQVCADLEAEGYEVQPFVLPACGVDAPHRRYRTFFIAYAGSYRDTGRPGEIFQTHGRPFGAMFSESDESGIIRHTPENPDSYGRNDNQRQEKSSQRQQRDASSGDHERVCVSPGDSADSDIIRQKNLQTGCSWTNGNATKWSNIYGRTQDVGIQRSPYDTGDLKLKRSKQSGEFTQKESPSPDEQPSGSFRQKWEEFPTQPPVCGGDDGISEWLDPVAVFEGVNPSKRAIPFNRWRSESIKAYGNAVVVPLIVQIFETITLYEQSAQK